MVATYHANRLEHVVQVLVLFGFQSRVDPVDHVVVGLLLLLLKFLEFLECLLGLALGGALVDACKGGWELLADLWLHLAPGLPHLLLVGLNLVQRRDVPLRDLVVVLHAVLQTLRAAVVAQARPSRPLVEGVGLGFCHVHRFALAYLVLPRIQRHLRVRALKLGHKWRRQRRLPLRRLRHGREVAASLVGHAGAARAGQHQGVAAAKRLLAKQGVGRILVGVVVEVDGGEVVLLLVEVLGRLAHIQAFHRLHRLRLRPV